LERWQVGQRGNQVAITRAMASRAQMKLSWKWRSGREELRVGLSLPSGRGGKTPHTFGNDERVAAESDRDVVVPGREVAAFVVVQAEFALEVLVDALGSPALHHQADELLLGSAPWQRDSVNGSRNPMKNDGRVAPSLMSPRGSLPSPDQAGSS
jgi:hypothetical protein